MLDLLTLGTEAAAVSDSGGGLLTLDNLLALLTLTALEIVLGIDNIVFIAILTGKLPEHQRAGARRLGLGLAMVMRILLLFFVGWIITLTTPLFEIPFLTEPAPGSSGAGHGAGHVAGHGAETGAEGEAPTVPLGISGKDLIVLLGGLFLLAKAVYELHHLVMGHTPRERVDEMVDPGGATGGTTGDAPGADTPDRRAERGDEKNGGESAAATGAVAGVRAATVSFGVVIAQILMLDLVFSVDSVLTAVGMTKEIWVMVTAVVISVGVMLVFAGPISRYIERHPTLKVLALAFLVLIGVLLLAEGFGQHVPRGYVYFAMAFALAVDLLQLRADRVRAARGHA